MPSGDEAEDYVAVETDDFESDIDVDLFVPGGKYNR